MLIGKLMNICFMENLSRIMNKKYEFEGYIKND